MAMIGLQAGPWALVVDPATGGQLVSMRWQDVPILRPAVGAGVLDGGGFAMVPFSNRIAGSRFAWGGQVVTLAPNHPAAPAEPVLHGFGWVQPWAIAGQGPDRLALRLELPAGAWPWPMRAEQGITLTDAEAIWWLALTNLGDTPMPAGLGFHPFFPRDAGTRLIARHRGEWQTDEACLPTRLHSRPAAIDWWDGQPVGTRLVDTVYTGREGPLLIHWPERGLSLALRPSDDLPFTTIYVPPGADFFCAEPVSHMTDAFNRPGPDSGMRLLAPGERWQVEMRLQPGWL